MKQPINTKIITAITFLASFFIITYISCKKGSSASCPYCANGSECVRDTCRCPVGYQGQSCDTISRTKFTGAWNVYEKGSLVNTPTQYSIVIYSNNAAAINDVLIQNFYNYFASPINANVINDTLFIPSQTLQGKTMVGKGYILSDSIHGQYGLISMYYEIIDSATSLTNDFGYITADSSQPSTWTR